MSKDIAIITPTYPPYRGGIGKVAEQDAAQLRALGRDVDVFTPAYPGRGLGRGVRGLLPLMRYGNAALVPGAFRIVRDYRTVILHYPFFGGAEFVGLSRRLHRDGRLILVYHMDVFGEGAVGSVFRLHTASVMPQIVSAADAVVVTSVDYAANGNLREHYAARPGRFHEIPPSVDTDRFVPGPRPAGLMRRYGLGDDDRIITFVGGLDKAHYFKGVPNLLMALTTPGLEEVKAVLVGDGDLRKQFERQAVALGLAGRAVFAGGVSDEELPDHYRLGDVFAFPSVDSSEAFGIVALESFASGVPVVASDLPGVRTIVREGETGLRVPPGSVSRLAEALRTLLADDAERGRFADNGRRMTETEYSGDARSRRWRAVLDEVERNS